MPWDIILLPLLGGFWFITVFYPTRFRAVQLSKERLLFLSATAAVFLAFFSRILTLFGAWAVPGPTQWIKANVLPWSLTGTAFVAFLLGPMLAWFLNRMFDKGDANLKAIKRLGDPLEKTLVAAQENADLVIFSLRSGKVYVGAVTTLPANLEGRCPWLTITPYFSGYRDPETKKVKLMTNYSQVIENFTERHNDPNDEFSMSENAFHRNLRVDDIEICGIFEPSVWEKFQAEGQDS